jgi:putative addiction module component (TIGR02574 family)
MNAAEIISKIKKLPLSQRKKVFRFLKKIQADEIETAWRAEIARRLKQLDSGKAKTIPAGKVFAKLRAKYG